MSYSSFELLDHGKPILVFGRDGQVGRALQVCLKDLKTSVVFLGRSDCDLSNELSIREVLNRYQPQVIINAAAYTAVDKAEGADQRELAFAINAKAPALMARYISNVSHGVFVHYSTDYVFGDSKSTPYSEDEDAGPIERLCVYGKSKLMGERAIKRVFNEARKLKSNYEDSLKYYIFRTSWLYGSGDNFINKIINLASKNQKLRVVNDQIGVPTSARWLAEISMQIASIRADSGIYHVVPDGEISWYELATFSVSKALGQGLNIKQQTDCITSVKANDFFKINVRPYNSRLDNRKLKNFFSEINPAYEYPHWESHVEDYIKELCLSIQ